MAYHVEPPVRTAFRLLQPFFGRENQARTRERLLIGDAVSSAYPMTSIMSSIVGKLLEGKEKATREKAVRLADWLTGLEIIGCGAETLVTKVDDKVIKFAVDPYYRPDCAVEEMKRRLYIASLYLGNLLLPTEFHIGTREGGIADSVVMTQDFVNVVGDAQFDAFDPDAVEEVRERSLALAHDWGILVDFCPGRGNLAIVRCDGTLVLRQIDTSMVLREEDGQPMPLARRFKVDAKKVEADIRYLHAPTERLSL